MTEKQKRPSGESAGKRKAYRPPKLTVHGNVRELTRAKAGTKNDGTGKPATKASGGNA